MTQSSIQSIPDNIESIPDNIDVGTTRLGKFLKNHAIRVRDSRELSCKLDRIRAQGPWKFQLVSDFDRTLTPQWIKDPCAKTGALLQCLSSHGVIESSPLLSPDYVRVTKELAEHYIPMEHDHRLELEEKKRVVEEWYHKAHECMLREDVSQNKLVDIVKLAWSRCEIHLRNKCADLFTVLRDMSIPVTVLSAGIADVIESILDLEEIPVGEGSNVMVVGNRMMFDSAGKHVGFAEPVIHSLNKRDALSHSLHLSTERAQRPNALLMGDLIGDVDFVHSIPHLEEFIAIGFLGDPKPDSVKTDYEDRIETYLKHYDIVILNGSASVEVALELIKSMFR